MLSLSAGLNYTTKAEEGEPLTLPVILELRLTDLGLVDVSEFRLIE